MNRLTYFALLTAIFIAGGGCAVLAVVHATKGNYLLAFFNIGFTLIMAFFAGAVEEIRNQARN
jgi:hypothetical protein